MPFNFKSYFVLLPHCVAHYIRRYDLYMLSSCYLALSLQAIPEIVERIL